MEKITDYKYALDESSIVAITDQKGIINIIQKSLLKNFGQLLPMGKYGKVN
jgi:hypothetical protein